MEVISESFYYQVLELVNFAIEEMLNRFFKVAKSWIITAISYVFSHKLSLSG